MDTNDRLVLAARVDEVAEKNLLPPNPQLDNAKSNSRKHGLPPIAVPALHGQYLAIQCKLINAKSVLEIGALGGYSTIWLASSGAKVTSIEISPKHRDVAIENTKGLDVEVILGAALDVLPKLAEEGRKFDLVFIDADWGEQFEYFEWAVKLTRKNGCIYIDNVVRELLESNPNLEEGKESLLSKIGTVKNVDATLMSTVSGHKEQVEDRVDGFVLAVVKDD